MQDGQLELVAHEGEEAELPKGAVEGGIDEASDIDVVETEFAHQPAALLLDSRSLPDSASADQEGWPVTVVSLSVGEAGDSQRFKVEVLEMLEEEGAGVHESQDSAAVSGGEGDQLHVPE